jgi:hypothetical protein
MQLASEWQVKHTHLTLLEIATMKQSYLILLLAILLIGCSTTARHSQFLPVPSQRIVLDGYSLVPPNEAGWIRAPSPPERLVIGKRGDAPDQTMAIDASVISIYPYKTTEEFAKQVNNIHMAKLPADRMRIIKYEATLDGSRPEECVITNIVAEDMQAVKRSTSVKGVMTMAIYSLTCALPTQHGSGIAVAYSQRYYPENADPDFLRKAQSVISSVILAKP